MYPYRSFLLFPLYSRITFPLSTLSKSFILFHLTLFYLISKLFLFNLIYSSLKKGLPFKTTGISKISQKTVKIVYTASYSLSCILLPNLHPTPVSCILLQYPISWSCIMHHTPVSCILLLYPASYSCILHPTIVSCILLLYHASYSCILHPTPVSFILLL